MSQECDLLGTCGFFKKYKSSNELACQGFIQQYCKGPKQGQCKRKAYRQQHGAPPPDEMMPSGQMMSSLKA